MTAVARRRALAPVSLRRGSAAHAVRRAFAPLAIRRALALGTLLLLLALPLLAPTRAGAAEAIETTLYFGLRTDDGGGVSEQAWTKFLAEVITPRFPDGLTVLEAYGQSDRHEADGGVTGQLTRVLIVVHPASPEATAAVAEIKAEWHRRFPGAGLFHTESDVRIVEE
jgi:hypothetical protein